MALNPLQNEQLKILKIFVDYCEEHNLRYFMAAGSLIGAVRHRGFIPWDDDIDVGMPRKDYDRFIKMAKDHFNGDIFLQTYKTDPRYPYNFAKLRNSNTTFIEDTYQFVKMNQGIYIDIFPFDGVSKSKSKKKPKWPYIKIFLLQCLFVLSFPRFFLRTPRLKYCVTDILIDLVCLPFLIFSIGHVVNRITEAVMHSIDIDKATYVANVQCGTIANIVFPRSVIEEEIYGEFEGIKVKIPKDYDTMLRTTYGEYMKLPPLEKQTGHHHHNGLDVNVPYKEYIRLNRNKKRKQ